MYFPYFVAYMLSGFVVSLLVLFWALNHDQFRDQRRLRYLPLAETSDPSAVKPGRLNRLEGYVMMGIAVAGLLTTAAVLLFTLWRW